MIKIITVLKSGPEWIDDYVYKFKKNLEKHISVPFEFICLSDIQLTVNTLPLIDVGNGYWNKLQLFRPEFKLIANCLYFDLDTIFLNNIDDIILEIQKHHFLMLQDPWKPTQSGSGMMWWNGDYSHLWNEYLSRKPDVWAKLYNEHPRYGDQGFIIDRVDHQQIQQIVSNPAWIAKFGRKEANAISKILIFAGKNRKPWLNTSHPDVMKNWI
jgi:hypothetical protein